MSIQKDDVINALKTVYDPDIGLDIYFLGLVYNIEINEPTVIITMTFTTPMCPMAPYMTQNVKDAVLSVQGVENVEINVTFDPPWEPSQELKDYMGF